MKKIVELENRWKIYKYKTMIFYTFIAVFVVFILALSAFIKFQIYDKKIAATKQPAPKVALVDSTKGVESNSIADSTAQVGIDSTNRISFTCRQVIVNRLNVRQSASFRAEAIGHYTRNGIFCADSDIVNGLLKTPNGWVSASDKYSKIVDVNMFVDNGFHKYQGDSRIIAQRNVPRTSFEEVRVFDKPNRANLTNASAPSVGFSNAEVNSQTQYKPKPKKKPIISITSQNITKEKMIEFKKADFRNTKDYSTAIEVARFYYDAKDYKNSIEWALNASNANSKGKQKSESFIIYAKSLYLSGKQEQALEVLTRYTSNTNAPDAVDVLNKMKQGII